MSLRSFVARCAGAPRDLGFDQGQAFAERVRAELRVRVPLDERIRARLPASRERRVWRDLGRYFPHHAERLLGLATGARLAPRTLAPPLVKLLEGDGALSLAAMVEGEGALLGRSLPADLPWAVRHSAPETGYRSVELAPLWSVAAAIGVNEHGLAAMATSLAPPVMTLAGCAAPAALLVQDVLQRFDTAEKATEWALHRPAGGDASLVLADASGVLGGVRIEGRVRRRLEPEGGLLLGLAAPERRASLEKAAAGIQRIDAESLARSLAGASGEETSIAVADPLGRRLGLARVDGIEWHAVDGERSSDARAASDAVARS
ncbi:MAG: hypothetical protein ABFS41_10070 [Myxococcota bacterium]